MKVCAIMATCGRHTCAERSLGMFLAQDYEDKHLLIFQNSPVFQFIDLGEGPRYFHHVVTDHITIVNHGGPFTSLGHIYNEAIKYVPEDTDIITFWDDDDIFLPNHISEGVKGYEKGQKLRTLIRSYRPYLAYKPAKSYYRSTEGITLTANTLEPSIFVDANHVKEYGFSDTTTEQHLQWVNPLVQNNQIFADPDGLPTLVYNWGDVHIPTFKTSGDFHNPDNFNNVRRNSQDHGDGILTPMSKENLDIIYNSIYNAKAT